MCGACNIISLCHNCNCSTTYGNFIIFSDSLAAIEALNKPYKSKHYIVHLICNLISSLPPGKILIQWVPSHTNILGNEHADTLAKASLNCDVLANIKLPLPDVLSKFSTYFSTESLTYWDSCRNFYDPPLTLSPYVDTPNFLLVARKQQVVLSRLHLGVTKLTHGHIFSKSDPKRCRICNCVVTLAHIFIDCPLYVSQRSNIIQHCTDNKIHLDQYTLLGGNFPTSLLLNFLKTSKLISEF